MRLADAVTLLTVERLGSMSKAAAELGVTPSQVSKTVSRVEGWIDNSLFIRTGADVRPSANGTRFLRLLPPLVSALKDLTDAVLPGGGLLKIHSSELAAKAAVSAIVRATKRRYSITTGGIAVASGEGDADLVFGLGEGASEDAFAIGTVEWGLFGSRLLARRLGSEPSAAELADVPAIELAERETDAVYDRALLLLFPHGRRAGTRVSLPIAVDAAVESNQLLAFTIQGVALHVAAGKLVEIGSRRWETPVTARTRDTELRAALKGVASASSRPMATSR